MTDDKRTAVDKALSLLTVFRADGSRGVGVSELARRAKLTKSTAFRLLAMLERNGVVERSGSDYRLGRRLHELGAQVYAPGQGAIREVLTPYLADLYELTHEMVHLAVLHGTDVIYLNKLYGHRPVRSPSRVGGSAPAYCTAVGKTLLAFDYAATQESVARGLRALTERTIVDPQLLATQLEQVRGTGIAFDDEECVPGLNCVAAPVLGPGGRPVAALSVAGATGRFDPRAHATALRQVAYEASRALTTLRRGPLPAAAAAH